MKVTRSSQCWLSARENSRAVPCWSISPKKAQNGRPSGAMEARLPSISRVAFGRSNALNDWWN